MAESEFLCLQELLQDVRILSIVRWILFLLLAAIAFFLAGGRTVYLYQGF